MQPVRMKGTDPRGCPMFRLVSFLTFFLFSSLGQPPMNYDQYQLFKKILGYGLASFLVVVTLAIVIRNATGWWWRDGAAKPTTYKRRNATATLVAGHRTIFAIQPD